MLWGTNPKMLQPIYFNSELIHFAKQDSCWHHMTLLTEPPWVTGASQSGAAPSEQEATMESNGGFPLNVALEAECAQSTKSVKASGFALRTSKWRCMATTLIAPLAGAMHCLQTRARSGAWRARCTRCTRCMCHATASESVNIEAPHPGWRISHTTSFLWSLWLILMLLTVVCGLVDVWN